jgi:hypothetical protein
MLDKNTILASNDIQTEDVNVPEWGGVVRVRSLSGAEMLEFWDACRDAEGKLIVKKLQSALLVKAIVGEDGQQLFDAADMSALMAKNAAAITRVFEVAQRLNGIGTTAASSKNSDAVLNGDLPSA